MAEQVALLSKVFSLVEKNADLKTWLLSKSTEGSVLTSEQENRAMEIFDQIERSMALETEGSPLLVQIDSDVQLDPERIYMDGCFDLIHAGHYNAIRQAKQLGKVLVVGVHSDAEIAKNKGAPVLREEERYAMVRACKWVDEVIEDAPYSPTVELLNSVRCMYAAHGDDCSINCEGEDAFGMLKRIGRCKIFKRTEGVSTTNIVGKLLLMTRDEQENVDQPISSSEVAETEERGTLTTSRRISQFSNRAEPKEGSRIIYIDGTFDLFHIGHVEILKQAKAQGDFLIVGVHDDATVNQHKGSNYPILSLHERVMCVLSQTAVDEVIIGAPWVITRDLIVSFKIDVVCQGAIPKGDEEAKVWRKGSVDLTEDPYRVAKEMDKYQVINSNIPLDTRDIIERIIDNRKNYIAKFLKTSAKEENYYTNQKEFVQET